MSLVRERELFEACLERDAAERARFLERECASEAERARIEALLAAHAQAREPVASLPDLAASLLESSIGPYRLLERIGQGGMGEVYLAEQERPVRRRVALKILRAGMDSREVVARFELERQTLALMEHPNVARILDAGATEAGQPYVVMEHVPGLPITRYCDETRLTIDERLALFCEVCAGVQHAHQRGIIHRDLKPSNILVTELDGRAVPKIIDFGIAKATTPRLDIAEPHTRLGHLVGTPDYMSPEQAELSPLDIDTRADVYALGVLLNELLTGGLPHSSTKADSSPLEIAQSVARREPVAPSRQVRAAAGEAPARAATRGLRSSTLEARLRGDLDWIVLKALDRDRRRRYRSPAELASDIDRHLTNEPVSARPPDALYVLRKFARRHRLVTATTTVALASIAVFGLLMAMQAEQIARERDRAEREAATSRQVSRFLIDLFQVSAPDRSRGEEITARELLDRGAAGLDRALREQPVIRARLESSVAEIYFNLGAYEEALTHYQDATDALIAIRDPADRDLLGARRGRARALAALGRADEAEQITSEVLATVEHHHGADDPLFVDALNDLGGVRYRQGRFQESRELFERAWHGRARVYGDNDVATAISLTNLAVQQSILGEYEGAERSYLEVIERLSATVGEDHPQVLVARTNLATLYTDMGQSERATAIKEDLLPVMRRVLGENHDHTLTLAANLANDYSELGRHLEALHTYEEVVAGLRRSLGEDHSQTLYWQAGLAQSLDRLGRREEAESVIENALGRAGTHLDPAQDDLLQLRVVYADLLRGWQHHEAALAQLDATLAPLIATLGLQAERTQQVLLAIADSNLALGRNEIAAGRLRQARVAGNDFSNLADYPRLQALERAGQLDALLESPDGRAAPAGETG